MHHNISLIRCHSLIALASLQLLMVVEPIIYIHGTTTIYIFGSVSSCIVNNKSYLYCNERVDQNCVSYDI